jgi:hypothetical protein
MSPGLRDQERTACVFFLFLYQDTARLNSMATRAEQLVSELPSGTRVVDDSPAT